MNSIVFKYPVVMIGFILTLNGWSYHEGDRTRKFDGKRYYNENNNVVGIEYEYISQSKSIHSLGILGFKNSHHKNSVFVGGSYKRKTSNPFYPDYIGLKYGIVTGYEEQIFRIDENTTQTINPGQGNFTPLIVPTYSIKNDRYEIEFSFLPKRPDKENTSNLFMLLIKLNI